MERGEYERLSAVEARMWWFRGLHANLLLAWQRVAPDRNKPVLLDAGCGTGGFLARLAAAVPGATLIGLDLDAGAAATARAKSGRPVCVGSVDALPFADESLDGIFNVDVLCHRGVKQQEALTGFRRCLRPGGILVLNLPAYRWLLSGHDRAVDNVRRYGRKEVRQMLAALGFAGIRACYWNSLLFPLMVLRRLTRAAAQSDVALLPAPIEAIFRGVVALEAAMSRAGLRLPFGGSVLAVAVKR